MRQSRFFDNALSSVLPVRYTELICRLADSGDRARSQDVGLWPLAGWDYELESRLLHGSLL